MLYSTNSSLSGIGETTIWHKFCFTAINDSDNVNKLTTTNIIYKPRFEEECYFKNNGITYHIDLTSDGKQTRLKITWLPKAIREEVEIKFSILGLGIFGFHFPSEKKGNITAHIYLK